MNGSSKTKMKKMVATNFSKKLVVHSFFGRSITIQNSQRGVFEKKSYFYGIFSFT